MSTHTPGPWERRGAMIYVKSEDIPGYAGHVAEAVWTQDAVLIAAAPELLETVVFALHDAESRLYMLPLNADPTDRAILEAQVSIYQKAIAKAEGRV